MQRKLINPPSRASSTTAQSTHLNSALRPTWKIPAAAWTIPRPWAHLSLPSARTSLLDLGWVLGLGTLITGMGAELGKLISIIPVMSWEMQGDHVGMREVGFGIPCICCFTFTVLPQIIPTLGHFWFQTWWKEWKILEPLAKGTEAFSSGPLQCQLDTGESSVCLSVHPPWPSQNKFNCVLYSQELHLFHLSP